MSNDRVLRVLLCGLAALLALTACALPAHKRTVQSPPATPALTLAAAKKVLAAYETGNNRANATRSASLLAKYETDSALKLSAAAYRIGARLHPKTAAKPFYYTAPKFYVPRLLNYPLWFVVQSSTTYDKTGKGKVYPSYLVFARASAGKQWLVTLTPAPDTDARLPRVAVDPMGYASALSSSLAVSPRDLPTKHADVIARGAASPSAPQFVAGGPTAELRARNVDETNRLKKYATVRQACTALPQQPVYALPTTDGGALAFYAMQNTTLIRPVVNAYLSLSGAESVLSGSTTAYHEFSAMRIIHVSAVVPRRGKVTVLGAVTGIVEAHAS